MAVLGDVPDARAAQRSARGRAGDVAAADRDDARAADARRPVIASISSLWPLASTPATPTISPARTSKETPRSAGSPRSSVASRSRTLEQRLARRAPRRFSTCSSTSRPTISRARLALGRRLGRHRVDCLPRRSTVTRSATVEHLVELVGDEHDRRAVLRASAAQDRKSSCASCGGQHRGRLVEDQHLARRGERAQDLDPLLRRRREMRSTRRVGVDRQPEALGELARARRGRRVVEQRRRGAARRPAPGSRRRS